MDHGAPRLGARVFSPQLNRREPSASTQTKDCRRPARTLSASDSLFLVRAVGCEPNMQDGESVPASRGTLNMHRPHPCRRGKATRQRSPPPGAGVCKLEVAQAADAAMPAAIIRLPGARVLRCGPNELLSTGFSSRLIQSRAGRILAVQALGLVSTNDRACGRGRRAIHVENHAGRTDTGRGRATCSCYPNCTSGTPAPASHKPSPRDLIHPSFPTRPPTKLP